MATQTYGLLVLDGEEGQLDELLNGSNPRPGSKFKGILRHIEDALEDWHRMVAAYDTVELQRGANGKLSICVKGSSTRIIPDIDKEVPEDEIREIISKWNASHARRRGCSTGPIPTLAPPTLAAA